MRFPTQKLTVCALMAAAGIVLKCFFATVPITMGATVIKIPVSFMTIYLCGFIAGPALGAISGALIDLLSTFFSGQTPLLGLTFSSALLGAIAGFIYMISKKPSFKPVLIVVAVITGQLLCSLLFNTYFLYKAGILGKGIAFDVVLFGRLVPQFFIIPIMTVVLLLLMRIYDKIIKKNKPG